MQVPRLKSARAWRVCPGILAAFFVLGGCGGGDEARRDSIYELIRIPNAEGLAEIRGMLSDPNRDVRATALNALVQSGVPDAGGLAAQGLLDADGFVRATAAKLLGDVGESEWVPILSRVLAGDAEMIVRQRCAEALGHIGTAAASGALVAALDDASPRVRKAAMEALRKVASSETQERIVLAAVEDPSWEVRVAAIGQLGESGDPSVETTLRIALEDDNEYVRAAATQSIRVHEQLMRRREASVPDGPSPSADEPTPERVNPI